jgi:hypothetical protein
MGPKVSSGAAIIHHDDFVRDTVHQIDVRGGTDTARLVTGGDHHRQQFQAAWLKSVVFDIDILRLFQLRPAALKCTSDKQINAQRPKCQASILIVTSRPTLPEMLNSAICSLHHD